MELEPYLFFNGDCEDALNFYKDVFGGEITALNRFEGSPVESEMPPEYKNNIMHANFKSPTLKFMASDGRPGTEQTGSRISLSLGTSDLAEGKRVFDKLSEGGTVDMPLADAFWGGKFGMVTDKLGIDWMVSCGS